ncbi:hypothetical protein AN189_09390 [Loktanella sp. 3ANDIMAR09]|nr:hypothetical protein AN189_09390 [Loktanella sp. 3ANDIMAR09]
MVMTACGATVAGVDTRYSDVSFSQVGSGGFPELARDLGTLSAPGCVMDRATWSDAFVERNITTSRRVSNALSAMTNNGQATYDQGAGVLTIAPEFCAS